ncbi:MAG: resolvase [Ilumatobacteraceae bacterium]|nr:resolvase [Ilumatobacteraceae bacterium]
MQNNAKKLRLIGYLRCSTEGQVEKFGLEAQRQAISAWAKANGHRVIEVVSDDAISGTVEALEREGLAAAIDAVQQGRADGVLCARLDRLARSLTVQEAALGLIWQAEGRVFCADSGEVAEDDADDPMRTALRQIVGAIAQLDRALISKRLRDGRRVKAEQGGFVGGAPRYGFRAAGGACRGPGRAGRGGTDAGPPVCWQFAQLGGRGDELRGCAHEAGWPLDRFSSLPSHRPRGSGACSAARSDRSKPTGRLIGWARSGLALLPAGSSGLRGRLGRGRSRWV